VTAALLDRGLVIGPDLGLAPPGTRPRWVGAAPVPSEFSVFERLDLLDTVAREASLWPSVAALAGSARRGLAGDAIDDLLALVQALPFTRDPVGLDVYQALPLTLARGGDCEDLAALFVGGVRLLAAERGLPVAARAAWYARPEEREDHVVAVVSFARGEWQWCECSIRGARVGEHPQAAADRVAQESRAALERRAALDARAAVGVRYGAPPPPERWP
jgi:hypothetical protein